MNIPEFTELLKQHCHGDWWDKVVPFKANPEWGDCECCGFHPLTEVDADKLNKLVETVKNAGGPSPESIYPHCSGDIFIEWHSTDGENSIAMDLNNPFGTDCSGSISRTAEDSKVIFRFRENDWRPPPACADCQ